MACGGACQVRTEGVTVPQLCCVCHPGPRGRRGPLVGRLCGSFVLRVFTPLSFSSSPISGESAQGGLLHPRPTPAVMVAKRSKTHAQMCNSFPSLCLGEM